MVAPQLKLTKKVTADKEGAGPTLPGIVVERAPEVESRRFYVLSADIDAHGHTGGCMEKRQSCTMTTAQSESERSSREF